MKVTSKILVLILILVFAGCSSISQRTKCIGTSALAGAAIGAGVGAAVGNQGENDSGEGAAVGTAAGALRMDGVESNVAGSAIQHTSAEVLRHRGCTNHAANGCIHRPRPTHVLGLSCRHLTLRMITEVGR